MVRDVAELRCIALLAVACGTTLLNYDYPSGQEDGAVNVPVDINSVHITPGMSWSVTKAAQCSSPATRARP